MCYPISKAFHDDKILDDMRALVQRYVKFKSEGKLTETLDRQLKQQFEALHDQLRDQALKDYSHFDFLEKLYSVKFGYH